VAEDQPRVSNQVQGTVSGTVVQVESIENLVLPAPSAVAAPLSMRGDLPDFTGRDDDLRRLFAVIKMAGPAARAVAVHAVDGMPGVGKTAFCVHAAHELAERFPDGQIFLELHGHTPGQEPVPPERALNSLLIATGMDPKLVPTNLDDQARLWRDRSTGRKILILLDDAAGVEQVRLLLPGAPDCLVLITSRHYLGGLPGVRPLTLTVVPPPDGVVMLRRIANRSGDDSVVEEIVTRWCGCLPLAIALVAARWRAHPTWDARYLADLLADAHDRLEHLQTGDQSVRAAFDMSLHHLPTRLRRTFHLLGALIGPEFDAYVLAALTDTPLPQARQDLESLYNDHLVQETTPGRFRFHDLLRAYAQSHAAQLDPRDRGSALDRVVNYYLSATIAAADQLPTYRTSTLPPAVTAPTRLPRLDNLTQARAWLTAELPTLIAHLDHAAATDTDRAIHFAEALEPFLTLARDMQQALHVYRTQYNAATTAGNPAAQAGALNNLGRVQHQRDEYEAAIATLTQAHEVYLSLGDRLGQANTLCDLGRVQYVRDEYEAAASTLSQAHGIYGDLGDRLGQANALAALGRIQYLRNEYEAATSALTQAHDMYADLGDRLGQANTLTTLGRIQYGRDEYEAAASTLSQAHGIYGDLGDRLGQANSLTDLASVQRLSGEYEAATSGLTQAHGIYGDLGSRLGQANSLTDLASVQRLSGEYEAATSGLTQAHGIYGDLGSRLGQAAALTQLGSVWYLRDEYEAATSALTQAYDIYSVLGDQDGLAEVLNNLGDLALVYGQAGDPNDYFGQAVHIARKIGVPSHEAEALYGLARLLLQQHDVAGALPLLTQARALCPSDNWSVAVAIEKTLAELRQSDDPQQMASCS
jgi:tetratricopeptide (TPR) repeat protein